jgi:hypothetical protein
MPPVERPFPRRNFSKVWDLCLSTLKTDPILQPAVELWQTWDADSDALRDPTADDLPWLKITPSFGPTQWIDDVSHRGSLVFYHEFGVAGTDARNLMDMWEAILTAWFSHTTPLMDRLIPYRAWQITATAQVPVPRVYGEQAGLMGTGTVTVSMDLFT